MKGIKLELLGIGILLLGITLGMGDPLAAVFGLFGAAAVVYGFIQKDS